MRILYHAISTYHILECIIHKLLFHKEDEVTLILPDFIVAKFPQFSQLCSLGFFSDVILFPYTEIEHDSINLVENLNIKYEQINNGVSLAKYDKIYVAGAHFFFSILLISKSIRFFVFEDSAKSIFDPFLIYKALKKAYPTHAKIALKNGLFNGNNDLVEGIIVYKKNPENHNFQVEFKINEGLKKIEKEDLEKILWFFGVKKYFMGKGMVLLLTEQFSNLGMLSSMQQIKLYKKVIRFIDVKEENLIIKPHPDDATSYDEIFPKAQVIKEKFPSELIPNAFSEPPSLIVSVSSTALTLLEEYSNTVLLGRNLFFMIQVFLSRISIKYFIRRKLK